MDEEKRIVAFCDGKTNWARVLHTAQRRTGIVTQTEFKFFTSYDELTKYIEENVAKNEDGSFSELDYEKIFIKDYDKLEYHHYYDDSKLDHLTLYYYTIADEKRHRIHLPVEFKNSLLEIIKASKGFSPSLSEDALDFYKEISDYSDNFHKNSLQAGFSYSNPRDPRFSERREINYVPRKFDEPKRVDTNTKSVRRLAIFVALIILVSGKLGYKKYLEATHGNGGDFFTLDRLINDTDLELYRDRFNVAETMESLVREKYDGVSIHQLERFLSYISKLELSNYDNNESFNKIKLGDLKYFINCDNIRDLKPMMELIDRYDIKHEACFKRSNPKDNKPVLQKDKAKSCLNWTLPMILLNCKTYSPRFSGVPISNGSSINEHATSEEIRLFGLLPDAIRVVIIENAQRMYAHVPNYIFQHPSYFGKNILQDLEIAKGECVFRMSQAVSKEVNSMQTVSIDNNRGGK